MCLHIVVAGSRHYDNYYQAADFISSCLLSLGENSFCFLSGQCRGADRLGERYAAEHHIPISYYPAHWQRYGRAAGPIRNRKMIENCDAVICFWDGKSKGTASLIRYAKQDNKVLFICDISQSQPTL